MLKCSTEIDLGPRRAQDRLVLPLMMLWTSIRTGRPLLLSNVMRGHGQGTEEDKLISSSHSNTLVRTDVIGMTPMIGEAGARTLRTKLDERQGLLTTFGVRKIPFVMMIGMGVISAMVAEGELATTAFETRPGAHVVRHDIVKCRQELIDSRRRMLGVTHELTLVVVHSRTKVIDLRPRIDLYLKDEDGPNELPALVVSMTQYPSRLDRSTVPVRQHLLLVERRQEKTMNHSRLRNPSLRLVTQIQRRFRNYQLRPWNCTSVSCKSAKARTAKCTKRGTSRLSDWSR